MVGRTLTHDLVDLAVLFAANKFLVLIGQFDLDPDGVLGLCHESDLRNHMKSSLDCVVRAVDGEGKSLEGNLSIGVGTDISKHQSDVIVLR